MPKQEIDSATTAIEPTRVPARSRRRRWAILLAALIGSLLLVELGLRFVLFSTHPRVARFGVASGLRRPELFADPVYDDAYWKLQRWILGKGDQRFSDPNQPDPLLGWRSPGILEDYDHVRHDVLRGRRPVLLFGASFAAKYFGTAFAQSELAGRYCLLNYAVGGYGVDQVFLLLRECLDHFVDEDPIVVIGLVGSEDWDRAMLSIRGWPKPCAELRDDGTLAFPDDPVLPTRAYLEQNPVGIASYALRALQRNVLPQSWSEADGERMAIASGRRIEAFVRTIHAELSDRGTPYFHLVFHTRKEVLHPEPISWQEPLLLGLFDQLGIDHEPTRPILRAVVENGDARLDDLFDTNSDARRGHPTARAVDALLACFRSRLEP